MTDDAILFAAGLIASILVCIIVDLGLLAMGRPPTTKSRRRSF